MGRETDNEDGTKNNHRRGTDNQAKETGLQEAKGGSEDGDSEPRVEVMGRTRRARGRAGPGTRTGVTPRRSGRGRTPSWTWGSGGTWR